MGFGKPVERKGRNLLNDFLLGHGGDSLARHARSEPRFDVMHALGGALEPHGAPQLFGLSAAEARRRHGDPQQLLLEDRDAQGSLQDRLKAGMGITYGLSPGAPVQVGVDHLAHDGPRSDKGDLHHQIVEASGLHPGQGGHLGPAFDLEDPHRIRAAEHRVGVGVVRGQVGKVDLSALVAFDQGDRLLESGQHTEAQEIDLDDAEIRAVLLVPLHDAPPRHAGGFDGHDFVQAPSGDHDAAAVLPQVPGQSLDRVHEFDQADDAGCGGIDPGLADSRHQGIGVFRAVCVEVQAREPAGQGVDGFRSQAHHFAHLTHRHACAIGDDVGRHGRALLAVFRKDVLDDPLALIPGWQVEIDIRPLPALLGEEALEEQVHPDRIHRRDAQGITDRAIGRGTAPLAEDVLAPGEVGDVVDDEEISVEIEFFDHGEFVFDLGTNSGWQGRAIALTRSPVGEGAQVLGLALARRQRILGKAVVEISQIEMAALGDGSGGGQPLGPVGEASFHLCRGVKGAFPIGEQFAARSVQGGLPSQAGQGIEERASPGFGTTHVAAGHHWHPGVFGQGHRPARHGFVVSIEVPGDVHPEPIRSLAENALGPVEDARAEAFIPTQQEGQATSIFLELIPTDPALALVASPVAQGEQPGKPSPTLGRFDKKQQGCSRLAGLPMGREFDLRSEDRPHPGAPGGLVEARDSVNAPPIGQG